MQNLTIQFESTDGGKNYSARVSSTRDLDCVIDDEYFERITGSGVTHLDAALDLITQLRDEDQELYAYATSIKFE